MEGVVEMRKCERAFFLSTSFSVLATCGISALLLFGCAKQVTKQAETSVTQTSSLKTAHPSYAKKIKKDTLSFVIQFHDNRERGQFAETLEKLIKGFPSGPSDDSADGFFIKTQAVVSPSTPKRQDSVSSWPQPGTHQQKQEALAPPKNEVSNARFGGAITIFTPYSGPDPLLSPLVTEFPFSEPSIDGKGSGQGIDFCGLKTITNKKISITLTPNARNANGKALSAFDVVAMWNAAIKQHPAEGRALFRYVAGIDQFIAGREALIPGFQVQDEKTIVLQLSQPDSLVSERLRTSRLFPAGFKIGPYCIQGEKNNTLHLAPNQNFPLGKPFLNSCDLRLGKDANPFLSFSLNRYDIMVVFFQKDIEYGRRSFADKAFLKPCPGKRYFLSLGLQSADQRSALVKLFDRKDMLTNYVKAEGSVLTTVESPEQPPEVSVPISPVLSVAPSGFGSNPIIVLSRSDDPVSVIIADKLLADLTRAGLFCTIKSLSLEDYEKALIKREFGIAVGFVPESITKDQSERLRMATMWFADESNERSRIDTKQEFPLFSITTYLLCKNKIAFVNDAVEGVYCKE
jgi:hypothetical protein